MRVDKLFHLGAHLPVTGKHKFKIHPFGCQNSRGLQQKQLSFLLAQPAYTNEPPWESWLDGKIIEIRAIKSTMHHLHFGPVGVIHKPVELPSAVRADPNHKPGPTNSFPTTNRLRLSQSF